MSQHHAAATNITNKNQRQALMTRGHCVEWKSGIIMCIGLLGLLGCAGDRPTNLGIRDGALAPCPGSPNCVSSQATDEGHRISPLVIHGDPDVAFARLTQLIGSRNGATIIYESSGYLRVELRTALFVDDAEFLLDREQRVVHVRSASRIGYSDLGKNRRRMEDIRTLFLRKEQRQ